MKIELITNLILIFILCLLSLVNSLNKKLYKYIEYPKQIKSYHRRRDVYTGELVKRGQLEKLKDYILVNKSISYNEFHRILQCPVSEPGLNGMRASISYFKLFPPTRQSLLLTAVNLESDCLTLDVCRKQLDSYNDGNIPDSLIGKTSSPYQVRLIRVINRTVYFDWPFNRQRFDNVIDYNKFTMLIKLSNIINDFPDIVYFEGEELSFINNNYPFISLSSSSSSNSLSFIKPLYEGIHQENYRYNLAFTPSLDDIKRNHDNYNYTCPYVSTSFSKNYSNEISNSLSYFKQTACSFSDYVYNKYHSMSLLQWKNRLSKVGYYNDLSDHNHVIFTLAKLFPHLIDAQWIDGIDDISSWNPDCNDSNSNMTIGCSANIIELKTNQYKHLYKCKYKYLLVLLDKNGKINSGKLSTILAHSGAVTLLQISDYEYHFTPRLKPWVHYVPVSYNIADIVDKIEWLENHPQLAYRIAVNAKTFGESYLRLEDYYCYYGTFFKTIGSLLNGSDALIPFDPKPIITNKISADGDDYNYWIIEIFVNVILLVVIFLLVSVIVIVNS